MAERQLSSPLLTSSSNPHLHLVRRGEQAEAYHLTDVVWLLFVLAPPLFAFLLPTRAIPFN